MLSYDQLIENYGYEPTLYMDEDLEIHLLETVANKYSEIEGLEIEKSKEKDEEKTEKNENEMRDGKKQNNSANVKVVK